MTAPPDFAAIVLAGGRSTRLGRDKASEMLLDRPLLQHVLDRLDGIVGEIVVVRAPGQSLPEVRAAVPVRDAEDDYPGCGPLGGIATGLARIEAGRALAVACDMPLLSVPLLAELLRRSAGCDVVMPVLQYPEPLHAVYGPACLGPMRARLEAGQYKITSFLGAVHVCYMHEDECRALDRGLHSFLNTNTEADLDLARELLRQM
ncbi:MAG TPA: molybdenum cofactor guanylyltransferase [Dehalococcoidia bacterium]|nr:molybdenum cofactor guanylyltransferase [Dehalococcoidia bacterium]